MLSVPMWQMVLLRLGKKKTLFIGLPVSSNPLVLMMKEESWLITVLLLTIINIIIIIIILCSFIVLFQIFIPVWLDICFHVFQQIFIPVMIVLASVSENFPVYMIMCILVGISVATLFLLPWCVKPKI